MISLCSTSSPRYLPSFPTRRSSDLEDPRRESLRRLSPDRRQDLDLQRADRRRVRGVGQEHVGDRRVGDPGLGAGRSEEHTSELQSLRHLVCRLLLEKKNKKQLMTIE